MLIKSSSHFHKMDTDLAVAKVWHDIWTCDQELMAFIAC